MKAVRLKRPNGTWSPPIFDETPLRRSVAARTRPLDGPFTLAEPGVGAGPPRPKGDAIEHFTHRLWTGQVGLHLQMRNEADKGVHGRVVDVEPKPADTTGSPGVDLVVGLLNAQFSGQWEQWGIYVFKQIAGSSTYSDHAFVGTTNGRRWCGRAIDCHADTTALGDDMVRVIENELPSHLRYVLWRGAVGHYPGHFHVSVDDPGYPGRC
jgi:hypothetical protein